MKDQRGSIVPVIALLFGAAVVVTIFGYMLWPKDSDVDMSATVNVNKVAAAKNNNGNVNAVTNANVNTNTSTISNTNSVVNTNSVTNTNTTVDPTAGWKTYTNTTLKYSVKYPPTWKTSNCAGDTSVAFGLQGLKCNTDAATEDFIVAKENTDFNLSQRLVAETQDMTDLVRTTVTVDGITSTRITGTTKKDNNAFYGGGLYKDQVYVPKDGKYYRITYFIVSGEKKYTSEFVNFLSTFTLTK